MDQNVKLVLLDLDGTLLDENSQIPEEFEELVVQLRTKGVMVGIASGRNKSALERAFGSLFNEMACITSNGCANYIEGKAISFDYISKEDCKLILDQGSKIENLSLQVFFPDYILLKEGNPMIELLNQIGFVAKPCSNLYEHLDHVVLISTIDPAKKDHREEFEKLQGNFQFVTPGYGVMDFTPKGVSKAHGAKKLSEALGITMDQIMAIGDAGNDLDLMNHVGYPVAMANGMDFVKEAARYITKETNTDHGAILFLKEFFEIK